tara:strand:- start:288 stop:935 length:648 start_codon:yes stop_codon:yes gene_type:complete
MSEANKQFEINHRLDVRTFHKRVYTDIPSVPREDEYHDNRAIESLNHLSGLLKDKFLCHIGCSTGVMTQSFSRVCSQILAIDIEEESIKQTSERKYNCEIDIEKTDAIKYLQENPEINPEVFYLWMNYKAMEPWVEKILEVRGDTNPTIILGIGMQRFLSPVNNDGDPLQFLKAKELRDKYKGQIQLMHFPLRKYSKQIKGIFGLLILNAPEDVI